MSVALKNILTRFLANAVQVWRVLRTNGPDALQFWLIALILGVLAGGAALLFRFAIEKGQAWIYGTDRILDLSLPWWAIILIPTLGGLIVGFILTRFTPDGRVRAVADVIEGAAVRDGRMERTAGLASMLASLVTLSTGGSTGREGPVVHMAGVISTRVADFIRADGVTGRELLGCAVAAAVSASFNAPIAGALFALEVILRHFAIHAFAPIVIASVAGAVIGRLALGNATEFELITMTAQDFYLELPAFLLLGIVCGLVSVALMRGIFWADDVASHAQTKYAIPAFARPAIAGALLGVLAIWFPHIIGVGYEMTSQALVGGIGLTEVVVFALIKGAAVAITIAGRMGGGIFSPSLMIGALTGLAFGIVATSILPGVSGNSTLYAMAGMGAVAAAVLGAPISTTLIVFELTGDWQAGLAVMVSVSLSTALASRIVARSFFLNQLIRRNVPIAEGPQVYLASLIDINQFVVPVEELTKADAKTAKKQWKKGVSVPAGATFARAMAQFDETGARLLPVKEIGDDGAVLVGVVHQVDVLRAFTKSLSERSAEEHA